MGSLQKCGGRKTNKMFHLYNGDICKMLQQLEMEADDVFEAKT
jgi:hypothetical protein